MKAIYGSYLVTGRSDELQERSGERLELPSDPRFVFKKCSVGSREVFYREATGMVWIEYGDERRYISET